jgi:DNA repair exonuclease SbcCD ATPase subunit
MATLASPSAPPSGRIENAVERELARRRRLLRLYLLLLLVPLGLAAWFLAFGRSDQEIVHQTVEQRVAPVEARYEQIAPKLEQVESLDKTLPVVQQAAKQLQAQGKQVETLRQQVQEIAPAVQQIQAQQRQVATLQQRVQEIEPAVKQVQADQVALRRTMETPGDVKELTARLAAMERNIADVEARQVQVQRDLRAVQLKVDKPVGPAVNLDPERLNALIDARIRAMGIKRRDLSEGRQPPG